MVEFEFDMYNIAGPVLEGVKCNVEVDEVLGEVVLIDYIQERHRQYVETLGAPGTANYWLYQARYMLNQDENWKEYAY